MYSNPNNPRPKQEQFYQQPPPGYTNPNYYQQQPHWLPQEMPPAPKNEGYKTLAIIFFVIGFFLHIIGLIPLIGIIFGLLGACCDVCAFIFLCLI